MHKETGFVWQSGEPVPLWPEGAPGLDEVASPETPTITPFLVEGDERRSAVVICPGGGYAGRAEHEGPPIARWLNAAGISAFVCAYRVAPYRHPCPSLDAKRALRWVRYHAAELEVDPERVGLLGFSAGGHLAGTVGVHYDDGSGRSAGQAEAADPVDRMSCRPDALILCYPVISFGESGHHGSMVNLIGEDPPEELRRQLSLETQVTPKTPPTFLWHTADDDGVPVENSLLFAEALRRCGVPFELHVFQSGPHGLGLAPDDAHVGTWPELCADWLHGLGF